MAVSVSLAFGGRKSGSFRGKGNAAAPRAKGWGRVGAVAAKDTFIN